MKSTKLISTSIFLGVFLFLSQVCLAKNNFSNKLNFVEEKPKASTSPLAILAASSEVLPEFTVKTYHSTLDKFTPEQLNRIIGVWPEHNTASEVKASESKVETQISEPATQSFSPEQFVEILGLSF